MALEIISDPPALDAFTPLTVHQAQTPQSFFGGKPVLHYEDRRTRIVLSRTQLGRLPLFSSITTITTSTNTSSSEKKPNGTGTGTDQITNGRVEDEVDHATGTEDVLVDDIGVWVTSERFILYNFSTSTGVAVPYPSILLHAIQRRRIPGSDVQQEQEGIYMQLASPNPAEGGYDDEAEGEEEEEEEEEADVIDLTIFPSAGTTTTSTPRQAGNADDPSAEPSPQISNSNQAPIQRFFAAISACSNLHPDEQLLDPNDDDNGADEEEQDRIIFEGSVGYTSSLLPSRDANHTTLPPPVPGSGGWITAENVGEFFDEEGNWRGDRQQQQEAEGGLGPGAGTVRRTREEDEDDVTTAATGAEQDRKEETEGSGLRGEETKWRRTG
ncbi:MAG: hypothetical protein M1816_003664 [Peltula sp. TS41687]|nr:MAG: hypothetical protein M1816_003664 [Peltula sp. TS41687]